MTTFRDEVGAWFFVMFICLLAGKIWGWISEARVEALEQQPPANPRLYHIRLTISLLLSEIFDGLMLRYCVVTLIEQPRPGMMVMFAFEFAVLAITSTSTALKYMLAMQEKLIINRQMKTKVEERRQEIRAAREEAQGQAATTSETTGDASNATINMEPEEDIDENEIDVPGWQEKGRWMLFLDLLTGEYTIDHSQAQVLMVCRSSQVISLYVFLHHPPHVPWHTHTYHSGRLYHCQIFLKTHFRLLEIPERNKGYECQISRCYFGRTCEGWDMHHLPRGNEALARARSAAWSAGDQKT